MLHKHILIIGIEVKRALNQGTYNNTGILTNILLCTYINVWALSLSKQYAYSSGVP